MELQSPVRREKLSMPRPKKPEPAESDVTEEHAGACVVDLLLEPEEDVFSADDELPAASCMRPSTSDQRGARVVDTLMRRAIVEMFPHTVRARDVVATAEHLGVPLWFTNVSVIRRRLRAEQAAAKTRP